MEEDTYPANQFKVIAAVPATKITPRTLSPIEDYVRPSVKPSYMPKNSTCNKINDAKVYSN